MTAGGRLSWYAARMRAMSPAEIAWRVGSRATTTLHRRSPGVLDHGAWDEAYRQFRHGEGRPVLLSADRAAAVAAAHPADAAAVLAAADQVARGRFGFFGGEPGVFDGAIDWNTDPRTGMRWPLVPASTIDHRTHPGDPKWIWELNRLQHLPWLAQAWLFTGERSYADVALDHLDSWIEQNPVGRGIAWRGGFEAGLRAISVAVGLQGLRDAPGLNVDRYRRALTLLAACATAAWRERSLFSSANNHLLGEMTGVAAVALLHPELARAGRMRARAMAVLTREAGRQFLPDGANAEQASEYQLFAADLLLLATALLRLRGGGAPAPLQDTLRREAAYLRMVTLEGEPLPRYGDGDGGFALRLVADPEPACERHLAAVAAVAGGVDGHGGEPASLAAAWLCGGRPAPAASARRIPRDGYARDGGLVVLRRGPHRLTMDVGPLGHLSIAAHGHADALSVGWTANGQEVVGDPGTGSYYAQPQWRQVFRATAAHATATVDDQSQSVSGGPFLWIRHAVTTVHAVDLARGVVDAEHDGYTRLGEPVVHRRWLVVPPDRLAATVVDLFTGRGRHRFRTAWPIHPSLSVVPEGGRFLVQNAGVTLLRLTTAATVELSAGMERGDEDGRRGWWSYRFEHRTPAWLIGAEATAAVPIAVATVLSPAGVPAPEGLAVVLDGEQITVAWQEGSENASVSLAIDRPGAVVHRLNRGGP